MPNRFRLLGLVFIFLLFGCYPDIKGKVIDDKTSQPIAKAVVFAQWTKTHGLGLTSHTVYKLVETETDNDGKFYLKGVNAFFVDAPELVIYKEGYIPYRNDMTYKEQVLRDSPTWKNNLTYRLETIKNEDSIEQIWMFLSCGIMDYLPLFAEAEHKLSLKANKIREKKQYNNWLNSFRKVIQSLDKGIYSYEDIRELLKEKPYDALMDSTNYQMDWLVRQSGDKNSKVTETMKENGLSRDIRAPGSQGVFFIKK